MKPRVEHLEFRPHPLLRGGHLQTVVGIYLPRNAPPYGARRHYVAACPRFPHEEGDQLVLHEDCPVDWRPGGMVVLLIHGLAGSHLSSYMVRVSHRLVARGHCVFRMDMRGCGSGAAVAKAPTHCGRSEDVYAALQYLARLYPESPVLPIGFSLGGMLILNMLAELGDAIPSNYRNGLAICPPIDLFDVERRFDRPGGRPYDRFFVRLLWKQITERWRRFPEVARTELPARPRRMRQIDEWVIAPAAGFSTAAEYYAATQVGPRLERIRHRVSILAASDDPIVPSGPLLEYPRSNDVETLVVRGGGHLGFVAAPNGDPDSRWLDWRLVDWVQQQAKQVSSRPVGRQAPTVVTV